MPLLEASHLLPPFSRGVLLAGGSPQVRVQMAYEDGLAEL